MHPPAALRIGHLQPAKNALVGQQRVDLVHRWRLVVEILNCRPAVGGLAAGIGNARDVVEIELLGRANLPFDQHPIVRGILAVGLADLIGGEHHGDRHERQELTAAPSNAAKMRSQPVIVRIRG